MRSNPLLLLAGTHPGLDPLLAIRDQGGENPFSRLLR
jgi:hypothetical protein